MKTSQDLVNECKPEIIGIAKKVYGFGKEALQEAVLKSKTPIDDFAVDALIKNYEAILLAKIEGI